MYLRYHDGIEQHAANEDELIDQIVASMGRVNRKVCDKHRHATRDAHAKSHGMLVGDITIYGGLPEHLRQGLFASPASYPVALRLSTAPGDLHSDTVPSPRGMALKILGVPGLQYHAERAATPTQDLLLVNQPVIPFGHVHAYANMQALLEKHAGASDGARKVAASLASAGSKALHLLGMDNPTLEGLGAANHHILGETFYSMAALRYGEYVAKLCAAPLGGNVRALTGQPLRSDAGDSELRDLVVDFFRSQGAEYELRVQLCTDLERMPVEDASIAWPEDVSPYQPVARISIPPQDAYSPARRVFFDDVLSFNPWHCLAAHRPLGSIMRARIKAYEASSRFRHEMNAQPRREITSILDIPA